MIQVLLFQGSVSHVEEEMNAWLAEHDNVDVTKVNFFSYDVHLPTSISGTVYACAAEPDVIGVIQINTDVPVCYDREDDEQ